MKMLSLAASTLERLHELKKTATGLDKDPDIGKELPVLTFRDLSKEDLERIQADHEENWGDDDVIEGPEHERASDPDDDPEEEENEIVEIRPREADEHVPTIDGCRLVRSAR
jgi:hypothetical protein